MNLQTERSDYDIQIITKETQNIYPNEYVKYKNKKIHWYYNSLDNILGKVYYDCQDLFGNMLVYFLKEKDIIYINPNYQKEYEYILKNQKNLGYSLSLKFYQNTEFLWKPIIDSQEIPKSLYTKWLYRLCCAYYVLTDEVLPTNFLKELKTTVYSNPSTHLLQDAYKIIIKYITLCRRLLDAR